MLLVVWALFIYKFSSFICREKETDMSEQGEISKMQKRGQQSTDCQKPVGTRTLCWVHLANTKEVRDTVRTSGDRKDGRKGLLRKAHGGRANMAQG